MRLAAVPSQLLVIELSELPALISILLLSFSVFSFSGLAPPRQVCVAPLGERPACQPISF